MDDKDNIRLLHQVLSSQIEFSKSQQWRIAYYILLLIGGLVGGSRLIYEGFDVESSLLAMEHLCRST